MIAFAEILNSSNLDLLTKSMLEILKIIFMYRIEKIHFLM